MQGTVRISGKMTPTFDPEKYGILLSEYRPKLIRTEAENDLALALVEDLMHRQSRTSEENELYDLLIALIEKFEQEFYNPGSLAIPHLTLQFLLEQQGLTTADLTEVFGPQEAVTEILKGTHEMTLTQAKAVATLLKVEPSVFL